MNTFDGLSSYNKSHRQFLMHYAHDHWLYNTYDDIKAAIETIEEERWDEVYDREMITLARKHLQTAFNFLDTDSLILYLNEERTDMDSEEFKNEYGIDEPDNILD